MSVDLTFTVEEAMHKTVRQAVSRAVNGVDTWLHHPSFNDKTTVLRHIDDATAIALAMQRTLFLLDGTMDTYPNCGVDWDKLSDLREAVRSTPARANDKKPISDALADFRAASSGKKEQT